MSTEDQDLYGKMIRIENKDIFIDLRKNENGIYLKMSERKGTLRKTILIPASGIHKLQAVLNEVAAIIADQPENSTSNPGRKPKAISPTSVTSASPSWVDELIPSHTVYVTGLTWDCEESHLDELFQTIGPVVKSVIIRKSRHGAVASMGRGLVEFTSVEDVAKAIATFNQTEFRGRIITCREDRRMTTMSHENESKAAAINVTPTKVLVTNVNPETSTDDLVEHFSVVGDVKKLEKVMLRGKFNGTWIVEYEEAEFAHDAILRINGSELDDTVLVVREYTQI